MSESPAPAQVPADEEPTHEAGSPLSPRRAGSVSSNVNPRSCVTCRRRKVRCDKHNPCRNCSKAHIECTFPAPGRAPRRSKKLPDAELLARLRRLETVVQTLGAQVDDDDDSVTRAADASAPMQSPPHKEITSSDPGKGPLEQDLGRLVLSDGRSRYVSNAFWASMGHEISEMRDILDAPSSDDEDDCASPDESGVLLSTHRHSHQSFIFGYASTMVDVKSLHPSSGQISMLWEVFKENVDPLVRILHRPTAKHIFFRAASSTANISKAAEALLFAVYFGAIVSLTETQCQSLLGAQKNHLINKYRFATEQALARAGFMNSSSLLTLQAFVFFLICVRHQDDTRLVWSLSGLALHLARAQGIHRDGTNFDLSPFETEMRRRLWWHISILDSRSSEDHGTEPAFSEAYYDTRLPLNVNDDDLYPEMTEWPKEKVGTTEMSFCNMRFELSAISRRMNVSSPRAGAGSLRPALEEKEALLSETVTLIEEKYIKHCDMSVPIFWVTATVGRLILAKMWLQIRQPQSYSGSSITTPGDSRFSDARDCVFTTSLEVMEFSHLLELNDNTAKWGWLFRTYMQWQAVAFVLSELCVRPPGVLYSRAWRAVDSVYDERIFLSSKSQRGMLWKPLRQLYHRAKAIRQQRTADAAPPGATANSSTPDYSQVDQRLIMGGVVGMTAQALDMDFNFNDPMPPVNDDIDPPAGTGAYLDPDRSISEWLSNGHITAQNPANPEFLWSGWGQGLGDFTSGADVLHQYPLSNIPQQEWY